MKKLEEAFLKYDVSLETHEGKIDKFISDESLVCPFYKRGDIVFVRRDKNLDDDNHIFIITDDNPYIGNLITTTKDGKFIKKDNINNLLDDSYIVDDDYELDNNRILFKIGEIKDYNND